MFAILIYTFTVLMKVPEVHRVNQLHYTLNANNSYDTDKTVVYVPSLVKKY